MNTKTVLRILVSLLAGLGVFVTIILFAFAVNKYPEYSGLCVTLFIIGFVAWAVYNILLNKGY